MLKFFLFLMKTMGKIDFFKMSGCGFCDEAEKLLKEYIHNGLITIKTAKQCQEDGHSPRGFPFFYSGETGQSKTGLPKSFEDLCAALGVSTTHDSPKNHHSPTPGHSDGMCKVWVMKGCPWCTRLIDEIQPLIKSGKCTVIQHDDLNNPPPHNASGFPHSTKGGKSVSGYQPYAEFVQSLEIDVTVEQYPMRLLQQALHDNKQISDNERARLRENFAQVDTVSAAANNNAAVMKAQQNRVNKGTVDCDKLKNQNDCTGGGSVVPQQNCQWNSATSTCGMDPRASSQVIDPRTCALGNCPPQQAAVPPQYRKIMLEGGEIAWVDDWGLLGPDAFTLLAFSGCESNENGTGGCKSGYSMFGVL